MKSAPSKPELLGLMRSWPRLSVDNVHDMLDNSDADELDLEDYYPESDLESISGNSSDEESEESSRSKSTPTPGRRFRTTENGGGMHPVGDISQISVNLANGQD